MQIILIVIWSFLCWLFRPLYKWFLHKTTRLSELQRICYGTTAGASRTLRIEECLAKSRTKGLKALMQHLYKLADEGKFHGKEGDDLVEYAVAGITRIKRIDYRLHREFLHSMGMCIDQLLGYHQLIYEVEKIRKVAYNSQNAIHEAKLLQLWSLMMPGRPLTARVCKDWGDIGFQGEDPKTDFRGMGILGLDNLLYFASEYSCVARHVLSHSHHPSYGYSFAIVGINLTSIAYNLLMAGSLKVHLFNYVKGKSDVRHFHQVYSYLFYEFDKFWLSEKPKDIMEFNKIREKFLLKIQIALQNHDTCFKVNPAIETI